MYATPRTGALAPQIHPMSELIQRITQITEEVRQGTRTSNREKDVLTQALEPRSTLVVLEELVFFLGN